MKILLQILLILGVAILCSALIKPPNSVGVGISKKKLCRFIEKIIDVRKTNNVMLFFSATMIKNVQKQNIVAFVTSFPASKHATQSW